MSVFGCLFEQTARCSVVPDELSQYHGPVTEVEAHFLVLAVSSIVRIISRFNQSHNLVDANGVTYCVGRMGPRIESPGPSVPRDTGSF